EGDLAIVAHGTLPAAPAPWTGPEGIPVDSHLRALHAPRQRIYAAGGVAVHHYPGHASYRIDHWDDSTAQGAHAARALLYDLGSDDDPGTYLPVSPFSARIHGHTLTGAGHPALAPPPRLSPPTHCSLSITAATSRSRSPGSTPRASSTTGYPTCTSRQRSVTDP